MKKFAKLFYCKVKPTAITPDDEEWENTDDELKAYFQADPKYYNISKEQLEIEKYIAETDEAKKDETSEVLNNTKEAIKLSEEISPSEESSEDDEETLSEPIKRITGDPEEDKVSDKEKPKAKKGSDEEALINYTEDSESNPEIISAESIRSFMSNQSHLSLGKVSLEDFYSEYENGGSANPLAYNPHKEWANDIVQRAGDGIGTAIKFTGRWLGELGIRLATNTLPSLSKQAYKGLLYAFDRLGHSFHIGITALNKYINRHINSFSRLHEQLSNLEKASEILLHASLPDISKQKYTSEMLISQMITSNSVGLSRNLSALEDFVKKSISDLGHQVKEDLVGTRELISYSNLNNPDGAYKFLEIPMKFSLMSPGDLSGYNTQSELLNSFKSRVELPGNIVMIAHLPKVKEQERDKWIEAYRDSEIFLAVDRQKFKLITELSFMEAKDLYNLIKQLKGFCLICLQQQIFYESLAKEKLKQKIVYKNYFENLLKRDSKISVRDSLIDLVIIKNNFLDKVYLPAAMDIHDYGIRVINAYLHYIVQNIKVLTP